MPRSLSPRNRHKQKVRRRSSTLIVGTLPNIVMPEALPPSNMTLGEALDRYEDWVTPRKKGAQEEIHVMGVLRMFLGVTLDLPLEDVRPSHIANYRDTRRANPSYRRLRNGVLWKSKTPPSDTTIRKEIALISNVFARARLEWGLESVESPVIKGLRPRPNPGRTRRLSRSERIRLLAAADAYESHPYATVPIRHVIELALATAMRFSELAGLRWDQIDLKKRVIQLDDTKNGERRAVPLSPTAIGLFRQMNPNRGGAVFTCTPASIRTAWNRVRLNSGLLDFRFHDLRHEAISSLIEVSESLNLSTQEIQAITGHKTPSMLNRYFHARATRIAEKLSRWR